MTSHRKITLKGIPESEMDEQTKLANRAMKRAARKLREDYRRKGLPLIVADKDGKIIHKPA